MFDHDKINFEVEKFPLMNEWQAGYTKSEKIPHNIGMGIRRKDTKEP